MALFPVASPPSAASRYLFGFMACHIHHFRVCSMMYRMLPLLSLERGIYTAPYRGPQGEPIMIAIDSRGRRLYDASVYHEQDADRVVSALWSLLDSQDPPPRPRLRTL